MIGEKITYFYQFFKIYQEYCVNFLKGQKIIKNAKNHPLAIEIQSKLPLDFESYIIKPVQRPPKYQLLLK
jgi:hypothetical protein